MIFFFSVARVFVFARAYVYIYIYRCVKDFLCGKLSWVKLQL